MTSIGLNEAAHGVENNLQVVSLLKRTSAGTISASATDSTASTTGQAILYGPNSTLIAIFQLGSSGAVGLCFATSTDLGQTWSAPTQISSKQTVSPAAVINTLTGDVHLVYAIRGLPVADGNHGIFYRVLAWNGSGWTVGGESTIIAGGVSGYGNVSLAVDGNGFLCAGFIRQLGSSLTEFNTAVSNSAWDLSSSTINTGQWNALSLNTNARVGLLYLPELTKWFAFTETAGTVRLWTSLSVLSSGAHSLSWTQQTTFFIASTDQIDVAWCPSQGVSGVVGIVYANSTNVQYVVFDATTNVLGSPTTLNASTAKYPTITRQAQHFWLGWVELVSGNVYQVKVARDDALTAIYTLDTDPTAGDGWGWLRFPDDITNVTTLVLMWSDTLDPEANGFNIYLGQVAVEVLKLISTIATAVDTVIAGPTISDTGSIVEALAAGVAKAVADTGHGADAIGLNPISSETGRIAESFAFGVASSTPETGIAAESLALTVQLTVAESGHAAEVITVPIPVSIVDAAHVAEMLNRALVEGSGDAAVIAESLGIGILVLDAGHAVEAAVPGPTVTDTGTAFDTLGIGIGVLDSGHAAEASDNGPNVVDDVVVSESLNAVNVGGGPQGQQHYTILAATGQHFDSFTGQPNGWTARSLLADDVNTRLYVFEDIDSSYADIVLATQPIGSTVYRKLLRSIDGGQTFFSVGPAQMAYVAHAPDGSLWGVGNDGTAPAQPAPPPYGQVDGNGDAGWNVMQRQLFRSTDKGASWTLAFDDQVFGQFGRYPSYTQVAVDAGGRVMAVGIAAGAITGSEVQVLRQAGSGWQTAQVAPALMSARSVAATPGRIGRRVGESCFCAAGSRFIFGGNFANQLAVGPDRLWTSDDYGTTWDLRFSDELLGQDAAPPVDITYRGGVLYAVRVDPLNERPNRHILTSADNGLTWIALPDPVGDGSYSAVAYDYKLHALYVGMQRGLSPVWRMDAPNGGAWTNVLYNLDTVANDLSPTTAFGGIGVLSGLQLMFEVIVVDSGHASDHALQTYLVQDHATAVETLIVQHTNRLTVRLFMHKGRVRLKLVGNQSPAISINPNG